VKCVHSAPMKSAHLKAGRENYAARTFRFIVSSSSTLRLQCTVHEFDFYVNL